MALCLSQDSTTGALVLQSPQPPDTTTCALVALSGSEAGANPWAMSAEDATAIAVAIWSLWAVAWGIRQLVRMLRADESSGDSSNS